MAETAVLDSKIYDMIIIGMGPAGLTAALYAKRAGLSVLGMDMGPLGGKLLSIAQLENWPGDKLISGSDLADRMANQIADFGTEIVNVPVKSLRNLHEPLKQVVTRKTIYQAKTLLIATGCRERELSIPGESEFRGNGLSYCAVCDGRFYQDKDVVVIGGGNSAFAASDYLSRYAKSVKQVLRREVARADYLEVERVKANKKVELLYNWVPEAFVGTESALGLKTLQGVKFKHRLRDEHLLLEAAGVFPMVGELPNSDFILIGEGQELLNEYKYIKANSDMSTAIAGVFVAGDIRDTALRQVITASGDGAMAAQSAVQYLMK